MAEELGKPVIHARQTRLAMALLAMAAGGLLLLYWWRFSPAFPAAACSPTVRNLPPGSVGAAELAASSAVSRELAAGEVHAYRIHLAADRYLQAVAEQQGVDLAVALLAPGGQCLLEVDGPSGDAGVEPLAAVAPVPGEYRLVVRGLADSTAGRYRLAVEAVRPATPEDRRRAAALHAFAEAERLRLRSDAVARRAAVAGYLRSAGLWRGLGDRGQQAVALRRLGQTWAALGEVLQANRAFAEALELTRRRGDREQQARLLNEIGSTFRLLGEPQRAEECYRQALDLSRRTGNRSSEVTALNNLGVLHDTLGELQQALRFYHRARAGWQQLGDRVREAATLHNLGTSYCRLGRMREALDLLVQALAIRRRAGDRQGEAATLSAIGWAHYLAGDLEPALAAYDESIRLRREVGDQRGEAATLDRRGIVYWRLDRRREAVDSFTAALAIFRRVGDRLSEAHVEANLGWVRESWGEPEAALAGFARALNLFRRVGDLNGEAYALVGSARAEGRRGRLERAQAQIEAALAIIESVRSEVASPALRSSYLASRQEYYELLIELLMQRHQRQPAAGHDVRALEVSERARARGLLETLLESRSEIYAGLDPELAAAVRSLEGKIRARERRRYELISAASSGADLAALERELRLLVLEYAELQGRLREVSPRFRALAPPPLEASEIQQLLDGETVLLWYALGEERSFLWVVTENSSTSHSLAPRAEIEAAARTLYELLQRSHLRGAQEQARLAAAAMSDLVLAPAAAELAGARLLIAADGALHYVPFAALPAPGTGRPLIADHEIVYVPSASVAARLRRDRAGRAPPPGWVAVFADPVFDEEDPRVGRQSDEPVTAGRRAPPAAAAPAAASGVVRAARQPGPGELERLVHSRREAATILALVPPGKGFGALDFAASRDAVLAADLASYRLLHFATHGLLNAEHPELSGVVLSLVDERGRPQDGFLQVSDLYRLDLAADLVVLSACRTALGKEVRGEGLVGLTRGFLVAGASRVLVSLWNVDDEATAELMGRFYRDLLRQGLSPARALQQAQLALQREERWAAPYYWAGFTLQGDWAP